MKIPRDSIKLLELTFWFALITHAVGLFSMALLLMPGMPGGLIPDPTRIKYIAENSALWQAGWLPWQLSALSDFFIAMAFLSAKKIPLYLRILVLAITVISIIPDQTGQFRWVRDGSAIAKSSLESGDLNKYLQFEAPIYMDICGWAAMLYSVLAIFWTISLKYVVKVSRAFFSFSWSIWILSFLCSVLFVASSKIVIPFLVLATANAIFFPLLILWFGWVVDYLIKAQRTRSSWGRYAAWSLPNSTQLKGLLQIVGDNLIARRIFELIPPVPLASDISEVVYINYLVPAERLLPLVPEGLELQKLGRGSKEYGVFSVLTFIHSNFGPQNPPFLRKQLKLSGLVSNWRIHVVDRSSGLKGIYFLSNATDNLIMSLCARTFSEGMPMQVASVKTRTLSGDELDISFGPDGGTAPQLSARLKVADNQNLKLAAPWTECFNDFADVLSYCVPQERAISSQPFLNRICFQEIRLDIPLDKCKLLDGEVSSSTIESIVGDAEALCFLAPSLEFRFDREHYTKIEQL